jgi:long-chain acyl-CoA synthetase
MEEKEFNLAKPWLAHYPEGVVPEIPIPDKSINDILDETAGQWPKKAAIIFYGRKITYAELKDQIDRFAAALSAIGIKKGDRVALLLLNSPQYVIAFFGTLKIGAVVTPVSPVYVSNEIKHQLEDSGAETIVCLDILYEAVANTGLKLKNVILTGISEYLPLLKKALGKSILSGPYQQMKTTSLDMEKREGFYSFQDLMKKFSPSPPAVKLELKKDLATLHYTGGTTGLPKGVMLTQYNMTAGLMQSFSMYPFMKKGEESYIAYMPLYHIAGQAQLTCAMCFGWTAVLFTTPDAEEILKAISLNDVSFFIGAPTMFEFLKNHEETGRVKWPKLKLILGGADTLHENTIKEWKQRTRSDIIEVYGMTEGMGLTHANPINKTKLGSFGIPITNTLSVILDAEKDEILPVWEIGEIAVSGPQIMAGYWNNPGATKDVLVEIGGLTWYRTGDLGRMDEDGYFYFYDRKRDLIKYKGYRIYARETEEVIKSHPNVKDVGVVGVNDVKVGQFVKAFIVLEGDARGRLSEQDIKDYCQGKMAHYKVPLQIEFVGEIPKTDVGKVSRRELREGY